MESVDTVHGKGQHVDAFDTRVAKYLAKHGYEATPREHVWWITHEPTHNRSRSSGVYISKTSIREQVAARNLVTYVKEHLDHQ